MEKINKENLIRIIKNSPLTSLALAQSIIATLGSLFFSEVWGLVPCKLCWLQRIFMYPLPIILAVGLWRRDKKVYEYVLPLTIIGLIIAIYHNVMYYQANYLYGANETVMVACSGGVSCTNRQIEWLSFISIPLLSLIAFMVITILMIKEKQSLKKGSK